MDTTRLREDTAAEHAATEETVPLMSPSLTRAEYIAMLRRFYRIVSAWDRWADAHAPEDLRPLLASRRRATLLVDDLHSLGERDLPATDEMPLEDMECTAVAGNPHAVFLGRMYVMEGSTLGGQVIARHVRERLALPSTAGNSFFTGYGDETGARWREFKAVLAALPESETETVIASAKNMFTLFGEAMRDAAATAP